MSEVKGIKLQCKYFITCKSTYCPQNLRFKVQKCVFIEVVDIFWVNLKRRNLKNQPATIHWRVTNQLLTSVTSDRTRLDQTGPDRTCRTSLFLEPMNESRTTVHQVNCDTSCLVPTTDFQLNYSSKHLNKDLITSAEWHGHKKDSSSRPRRKIFLHHTDTAPGFKLHIIKTDEV